MGETVTWAGLDVHARSTHAAAINVLSGEITRARFGSGVSKPIGWLAGLPGPVKAFYQAGPTGFGPFCAARLIGSKTDRKDAELLARLGLAGSLVEIVVAPGVPARRPTRLTPAAERTRPRTPT